MERQRRRNKWILAFIVGIFLGSLVSEAISLPAVADDNVTSSSSETRYMSDEKQSVNELTAYRLEALPLSNPTGKEALDGWMGHGLSISWGMRVWIMLSNGSEIEITSGTPVAVVHRSDSVGSPGLQNATWDCPQVELSRNDSIVVRVYTFREGGDSWSSVANYTTEQLGAAQLEPATWKVYYLTRWYEEIHYDVSLFYPPVYYTYGGFSWGYGSASRIENFKYSETLVPEYTLVVTVSLLLLVTFMALMTRKKSVAR